MTSSVRVNRLVSCNQGCRARRLHLCGTLAMLALLCILLLVSRPFCGLVEVLQSRGSDLKVLRRDGIAGHCRSPGRCHGR